MGTQLSYFGYYLIICNNLARHEVIHVKREGKSNHHIIFPKPNQAFNIYLINVCPSVDKLYDMIGGKVLRVPEQM